MGMQLITGFAAAILISLLAWRAASLSISGAAAAMLMGGLIFGLGGLGWAALLVTFFISSSALSRIFERRKLGLYEKFSKGSRRDWGQVAANGGLGVALVAVHGLPDAGSPFELLPWVAYAGALAAVNADTWATELGVLSSRPPRLITTGRLVERGASGGISNLGVLASLGGALLIAGVAALFSPAEVLLKLIAVVVVGGLAGSLVDSLLGATIQAIYWCPNCLKETERHPLHTCSTATVLMRGWRWLNNDLVNFSCSLTGAAVAGWLWYLLSRS
jgi:uncharacterized protein (TIGR00297 family)